MIQFRYVWKQYDKIKKHNAFMKRIIFLSTRIFFISKTQLSHNEKPNNPLM